MKVMMMVSLLSLSEKGNDDDSIEDLYDNYILFYFLVSLQMKTVVAFADPSGSGCW
jgi:hypothetical protein